MDGFFVVSETETKSPATHTHDSLPPLHVVTQSLPPQSEEVEYKCPVCECNSATMACRLARLPR